MRIVRDHDWRFKKLSKLFPENCNFQLEMPKEEATFDPFPTHLIPKNLNIEELKMFGKASLRGWEGLCAFFNWFLKKCENNHALLWSLLDTKVCWYCLIFVSLVCLRGETRSFFFFAHGIHCQRFLNECIKLAVTSLSESKTFKV